MIRRSGLRSRVERLERAQRAHRDRPPPYLILCVTHLSEDGLVIGAQSMRSATVIARQDGEAVEALTTRAGAELQEDYLIAVYDEERIAA